MNSKIIKINKNKNNKNNNNKKKLKKKDAKKIAKRRTKTEAIDRGVRRAVRLPTAKPRAGKGRVGADNLPGTGSMANRRRNPADRGRETAGKELATGDERQRIGRNQGPIPKAQATAIISAPVSADKTVGIGGDGQEGKTGPTARREEAGPATFRRPWAKPRPDSGCGRPCGAIGGGSRRRTSRKRGEPAVNRSNRGEPTV